MHASNSFAQIAKLVLSSVRGEARPRAKHRFRTDSLEMFEERITPTTTLIPGQIPFYPPGQGKASDIVPCNLAISVSFAVVPGTDTVTPTVTNNTGSPQVVTFALYTAPGGGENPTGTAYDNISSQKLVTFVTFTALTGTHAANVSFDLSLLSTNTSPGSTGSSHLTGQQKFQLELYCGSFAPTKPTTANVNGIIIGGELGDYDNPGGTVLQHGPGR